MAKFRYRALAPSGDVTEGVMEAPDRDAVISRLRASNHLPVMASALDEDAAGEPPVAPPPAPGKAARRWRGRRAGRAQVTAFTRELEALLDAGLPLDDALATITEATANETFAAVVLDLRLRLREGIALSDAMAAHPALFGGFYRGMVRAGEAGGRLGEALARVGGYLERADRLISSVRTALIYPSILITAVFVSLIVLMTVVVPQFDLLLRESAAKLPWNTRLVLDVSAFLRGYGWLIALALIAGWFALRALWRNPAARARRDRWLLGLPIVGGLITRIEVERLARSLAALLGSGVPLHNALELAAGASANLAMTHAIDAVVDAVKRGERLADALAATGVFPALAVQLVRVGETGGKLEPMLLKLAEFYALDAEVTLNRLVALVEPVLIITVSLFAAVVVISLLSAVLGINAVVV